MSVFSQKKSIPAEFSVTNNNAIIWTKVYKNNSSELIKDLRNNLSLKINEDSTGTANNLRLRCSNLSGYTFANFQINFQIESKESEYRIKVSNVVFNENIQINLGSVRTEGTFNTLEDFELRTTDNTLRKNGQSARNLICLNEFLTKMFTAQLLDKW
jgi:hypothetical protein